MRYKGILMDADDTIFDFQAANHCAVEQMLDEIGYHAPNRFDHYQEINHACWQAVERGTMTQGELKVARFQRFFERYAIEGDPEAAAARFVEILGQQSMLLPYAEDTVRRIASAKPVFLLTNGITSVQKSRLARSPLKDVISGMVISQEVGVSKPNPEIFLYALAQLEMTAAEVLMIGDSATSDILGANRAGIDACWYNPTGKCMPEGIHAEYVISDIRECAAIALADT